MTPADPFDLERFVRAQAAIYPAAIAELSAGHKRTHWMWFVFPQLRGLGRSPLATFYGIVSVAEARAYLDHPVLGARLAECTACVLTHPNRSLNDIFGSPDDVKFGSSMTLFAAVAEGCVFQLALERFCGGRPDERTLALIKA